MRYDRVNAAYYKLLHGGTFSVLEIRDGIELDRLWDLRDPVNQGAVDYGADR